MQSREVGSEWVEKNLVKDGQRRACQLGSSDGELSVIGSGLQRNAPQADINKELLDGYVALHAGCFGCKQGVL